MKAEVIIRRHYPRDGMADVVMKAVSPDNAGAPGGTAIESYACDKQLTVRISSTDDLKSLLRTLDDLLFCIQTAERTLSRLGKKPPES